ncbi:hypothetical protein RIMD111065_20910 [Aeromonas hydrophila]|nr:hypothetical protein [Aeromonas hydrophila]BCO13735.1 hypothetical protein RIMD111065_20910 [Aeromonas hydrophila]
MSNYKQEVKEKSRNKIWSQAITKLTTKRALNRVLKSDYIINLWNHSFNDILSGTPYEKRYLDSWCDFAESSYQDKIAGNLKIAYFCGPEPENDLDIMLRHGVKVENVWAIESNKKIYNSALHSAREKYPTLKVFHGTISEMMKVTPMKFDIIYLDFTGPLFSRSSPPLLTINAVFEHQSLSDLGVLIINSTLPDKNPENIKFLSKYFKHQPHIEESIYTGDISSEGYYESADCNGYSEQEDFEILIEKNFECAYSAFSTHYPSMFAGYIQPIHRISNNATLKNIFMGKDDVIIESINKMSRIDDSEMHHEDIPLTYSSYPIDDSPSLDEEIEPLELNFDLGLELDLDVYLDPDVDYSGSELYQEHENFPIWHFIKSLEESETRIENYWFQQFTTKSPTYSYYNAVQFYDLLRNASYNYQNTLSTDLSNSIEKITNALPDKIGGKFCDVPMSHLWIELALNQLGSPYHMNSDAHWRAMYTAKERTMYLDLFVFDRCRALYDWIPMMNLYGEDFKNIERQIIIRSCIDAITKQNHYSAYYSYYGANLIGEYEKPWAKFSELKGRDEISR